MKALTNKKDITAYEYACGAVKRKEIGSKWIELYKEHGNYHVRAGVNGEKFKEWLSFGHLVNAKKAFSLLCKS